jgi:LacI family transcriptional regulator
MGKFSHTVKNMVRPTLTDVARHANVAVSTASKALNKTGRISAETRRRVLEAASELGYEKTTSKAQFHSGLVGLITSDMNGRFALPLLMGAESSLGASNHAALLMVSRGETSLEKSHINQLAAQGIDGLIVVGESTNPRAPLNPSITLDLPVIYAYAPSKNPHDCSVTCDNVRAGYAAIEYLLSGGKRRIAIIGGGENIVATGDRIRGARMAFKAHGMAPLDVISDNWSEDWGEMAAHSLLHRFPKLDAFYCLSDAIARGAVRGVQDTGRHVPSEVAVIGHDNLDVFATDSRPALTTFDNNLGVVGKTAAQLLLDAMHGHPHHGTTLVGCPLIARETTPRHAVDRITINTTNTRP